MRQRPWAPVKLLALVAAIAAAIALAACGGDDSDSADADANADSGSGGMQDATLVLDFVPGPAHVGIYRAVEQGYYEDQGINLEIIEPTSTADTLKLIDNGQAQFGIADGIDVASQIVDGRDAKGIMALTQRPLGGLITVTESGYESPADLAGTTVGVTGVPSDDAILETVLNDGGVQLSDVKKVTIGFNGVQNLENGKVDAFTGFIPADGVQVEVDGFPTTSFPLDEYGGPSYPGLVVFSTQDAISEDPELMQSFVAATIQGYNDVLDDQQLGVDALLAENPAIPQEFAEASTDAYMPLFIGDSESYGVFDIKDLEDLSAYMVESGLAQEEIPTDRYATNEFAEEAE